MTDHGEAQHSGKLLVATPPLVDPNFRHAVVLLADHDEHGALGFVLNRTTPMPVASLVPEWSDHTAPPPVVFRGGPVQQEAVLALGRSSRPETLSGWQPVVADVGLVDLGEGPSVDLPSLELRFFAGYAGWGPGQLEAELEQGSWFVVPAAPDDVLCAEPDELWRRVLRRQGGMFRTISEDPSQN